MIGKDLERAAALLRAGKIVAIPTETVYGLGGNALDPGAVAEIFAVKQRPSFDPLIVHLGDPAEISHYAADFPASLQDLAAAFMPGPLTILLPKKNVIPDLVTAGSSRVALRVPGHPLTSQLLGMLDFPLAAPSANPFGYISPTRAAHVAQQLGERIPYILDGGPCQVGLESTIVGLEGGEITVFRKGGVSIEQIEAVVGAVQVKAHSSSNPQAPGMLKSHYAPRIPLVLGRVEDYLEKYGVDRLGSITFQHRIDQIPEAHQVCLSPAGDYKEAAQNLFAGMRRLDSLDLDLIVAELLPEKDLGRAINDRLRRAAA